MSIPPIKVCDYCGTIDKAYTFADGETVCPACHASLPIASKDCRAALVRMTKERDALQAGLLAVVHEGVVERAEWAQAILDAGKGEG